MPAPKFVKAYPPSRNRRPRPRSISPWEMAIAALGLLVAIGVVAMAAVG